MSRISLTNATHGCGRWLMILLALLGMTIGQTVSGQDDDDEPLVAASGTKMQTDSLSTSTFDFSSLLPSEELIAGRVQLPVLGRAKIGENNSALPQDRFYFVYKHFHNSLNTTIGDGFGSTSTDRDFSLNRYNIGLEKTFDDGLWSIELRLPFIGNLDFAGAGFSQQFGSIGNVSVIGKRLIYVSQTAAWSTGLGVSAPTGADSQIRVGEELFTVQNEAVHMFPFVGFLSVPTKKTFLQGFIQLDVPTNGNGLLAKENRPGSAPRDFGSVRDQVLMYVDLSAGYRLYQNPSAPGITGLASVIELHYTTSLENANTLVASTDFSEIALGNAANRFDVVNAGAGLYTTWRNRVTMYTGIVAPLDNGTNRFFDMEAQMSLNVGF